MFFDKWLFITYLSRLGIHSLFKVYRRISLEIPCFGPFVKIKNNDYLFWNYWLIQNGYAKTKLALVSEKVGRCNPNN